MMKHISLTKKIKQKEDVIMASSKVPIEFVNVPDWAIALKSRGVVCNLRPCQRGKNDLEEDHSYGDGFWISKSMRTFLKSLPAKQMVALFFQGYGTETGTAIVRLDHIYWTEDGLPRLDFEHPKQMSEVNGCPNFWASMLLAIMRVPNDMTICTEKGPGLFRRLAESLLSNTEITKALQEGRAFQIGTSFVFAAQIPDDSVGCSGSRCTNCGGPVAYCEQVCKHCSLPLIGPSGFPQLPDWKSLSQDNRLINIQDVFCRSGQGRLGYANVKNFPLTPNEVKEIETLDGIDAHLFFLTHGVHPKEILKRFPR